MVLPLERMLMALNFDGIGEGSNSAKPRGPRPRVCRTVCIRMCSPVLYNFVSDQENIGINNSGLGINNNRENCHFGP
jgi:hypothetical protein